MKLIGSLTSPYVRKVRIVLAEKKIDYDFTIDPPFSPGSQVAKVNPLGKIPTLILDDGYALFDSRVIVEYLDGLDKSNSSALIPESGRQRLQVKRWEVLADGIADASAAIFLERKRQKTEQSSEWIERQQRKIDLGLRAASIDLDDKPWCTGAYMTLADVSLGCALDYLTFRFPQHGWRESFPNLERLVDKLTKQQSFILTAPRD